MISKAFEVFITYIQVIIWVWFVSSYFEYKYKGVRRIIGFVAAVNVITIEIAFINALVTYDGFGAIIFIVTMLLYARLFLNGDVLMQTFVSIFSAAIVFIIASLTIFYICYLTGVQTESVMLGFSKERVIIAVLCRTLEFIVFKIILYIKKEYYLTTKEWLLIIAMSVMTWCATIFITKSALDDDKLIIYLICLATVLVLINFMTYYFMLQINKANRGLVEYKLLRMQYDNIKENMANTKILYDNISSIKHDMEKHLLAIDAMASKNNDDEVCKYVKTIIDESFVSIQKIVFTESDIFNTITNSRLEICKRYGIKVIINIENDTVKFIEPEAIPVVIGNIFDNAIEAVRNCEKKLIIFGVQRQGEYVSIYMENTYNPMFSNINLETSKKNKNVHGYGLKNVEKVVDKHKGMLKIYQNNSNMFCCEVWLKIKK